MRTGNFWKAETAKKERKGSNARSFLQKDKDE
jgi:hypothetical protein